MKILFKSLDNIYVTYLLNEDAIQGLHLLGSGGGFGFVVSISLQRINDLVMRLTGMFIALASGLNHNDVCCIRSYQFSKCRWWPPADCTLICSYDDAALPVKNQTNFTDHKCSLILKSCVRNYSSASSFFLTIKVTFLLRIKYVQLSLTHRPGYGPSSHKDPAQIWDTWWTLWKCWSPPRRKALLERQQVTFIIRATLTTALLSTHNIANFVPLEKLDFRLSQHVSLFLPISLTAKEHW